MSPHRFCDVTRRACFGPVDRISQRSRWPGSGQTELPLERAQGPELELLEVKATDRRAPFAGVFKRLRHRHRGRSVRTSDTPLVLMVRALFDRELRWQYVIASVTREVPMDP